jgi:hypothetical protein
MFWSWVLIIFLGVITSIGGAYFNVFLLSIWEKRKERKMRERDLGPFYHRPKSTKGEN